MPDTATATRRELDLTAARVTTDHCRQCRPSLPPGLQRRITTEVTEMIVNGGHNPALIADALARWRTRRDRGEEMTVAKLHWITEDLERDAAREATRRETVAGGTTAFATLCGACGGMHEEGGPHVWAVTPL